MLKHYINEEENVNLFPIYHDGSNTNAHKY